MTESIQEKQCNKCKEVKHLDQFHIAKTSYLGRSAYCKECRSNAAKVFNYENRERIYAIRKARRLANPQKYRDEEKRFRARQPDRVRDYRLKREYGITTADYLVILASQNHKCALCKNSDPGTKHGRFAIDHDHATGKLRALLCNNCNTGIGMFRDSTDILSLAIDYLNKYK